MQQSIHALSRQRVAIYVDWENVRRTWADTKFRWMSRSKRNKIFLSMDTWEKFNQETLRLLSEALSMPPRMLEHVGTWISAGLRQGSSQEVMLCEVDSMYGMIVSSFRKEGPESGVDASLICNILYGAYRDMYDICVIYSDDQDMMPAAYHAQTLYGKVCVHAGFGLQHKLKLACKGHINLYTDHFFEKLNNHK